MFPSEYLPSSALVSLGRLPPEGRDYDVTLRANEGGVIRAYIDGEYAPVKQGKVTVPGGSDVQIRVATQAGYTLDSLVMEYADGTKQTVYSDTWNELTTPAA